MEKCIVGIQVGEFDKKLLKQAKVWEGWYSALGECAPRKRLLQVDYKEKGQDMHQSLALYQPPDMSDEEMIAAITQCFEEQRRTVSAIVEVDDKGYMTAPLYACPGFLEECREYMIKMFQKGN